MVEGVAEQLLAQIGLPANIFLMISTFGLVFARLIMFIQQAPFMGGRILPMQAKIGLVFTFFFFLLPGLAPQLPAEAPKSVLILVPLFLKEAMIGFIMGYTANLVFQSIQSAGNMIDNQRGVAQAALFSPALGAQASLFGNFKFQIALILFFILNGHLHAIRAVSYSFESFPLFTAPELASGITPLLEAILRWSTDVLVITMQLSAPALLAIFLSDSILGLANRIAPQMDVFFLAFNIKMFLGILLTFFALPYIIYASKGYLGDMLDHLFFITQNFP